MRSSYLKEDVTLLLKDITGLVEPLPTKEREQLIQAGKHYCEMLPIEYVPSETYMEAYEEALKFYSVSTAKAIGVLAQKVIDSRGKKVVLVSLARAGIPIGILLKRYLRQYYGVNVPHYSISIIRGKGVDNCAMEYILERHRAEDVLFVDGWIGKGAIFRELEQEAKKYPGLAPELAVAADPANITELCGTHEDLLIPSSCLNSTVSGLISRTFLRDDIIGPKEFHGAVFYENLKEKDLSYEFIQRIEANFLTETQENAPVSAHTGLEEVQGIAEHFRIRDINLIKPGIGETSRVLLRRVPWKVLISEKHQDDSSLCHVKRLAEEKQVDIEFYPLENYKACGIIKNMGDV